MSDEPETSQGEPKQQREPWRKRHLLWAWTAAIAGTAVFVVLLVWGPWWIEGHHLRNNKGQLVSSAGIIVTGFRTMLVAIAAGGFTAAGLYYTRQKHQLEREQFDHAQEQFAESQKQFAENQKQFETTIREAQKRDEDQARIARDGQVTGRYVEAIKLLASEKEHEQLGGIYSLARIMRDSAKDADTAIEVLAAFVRAALHDDVRDEGPIDIASGEAPLRTAPHLERLKEPERAALNVLGSREAHLSAPDLRSIRVGGRDLSESDLRQALLRDADLAHAHLWRALLVKADLTNADLTKANLEEALLTDAMMSGACLKGANLKRARLTDACLHDANLLDANLTQADLKGATFEMADLAGASLHLADLTNACFPFADLSHANFAGASIHGADLSMVQLGTLTAEQVCSADGLNFAQLPPALADDPQVQAQITELERRILRVHRRLGDPTAPKAETRLPSQIVKRLGSNNPAKPTSQ
ncbi:pentapeptide repeat-containing protein [Streptomyces sp. cg28]|uniref:pentapeptide repeat-containing protein n=1 Tax=Streptomyces sp. cg28 TaxID=3403457 RepID=UPI003B219DD7